MSSSTGARPIARRDEMGAPALRLSPRSILMLVVSGVMCLLVFGWPLILTPGAALTTNELAPMLLVLVVPLLLAVVAAEITGDQADVKALALLGVMSAVVAAVRPLGAGTAGIETVFLPIILSGRAFGPGFGFVLGNTGLFASALITAGVGPWLPYQMLAAGMLGLLSGLLPQVRGWLEVVMLMVFASLLSFLYGWMMDFSFWPFNVGLGSQISYDPALGAKENLHRFVLFNAATSMGWNAGRAITTAVLLLILGKPLLRILRRASRRASFG